MYDLYYWPTPNGHKIALFLEETKTEYDIIPVDIGKGEQFEAEFLKISPNNRIPALVDHQPESGKQPISLFESGAILLYLADKHKRYIPADSAGRADVLQWLFWQMGNLGPMGGQNHHFVTYQSEKIPYAINRYVSEVSRLYQVLDYRLENRKFICDEFSIADMACYPWVVPHERQRQDIERFPSLKSWLERVKNRPATIQAYDIAKTVRSDRQSMTDEEKKVLFNQDADTLRKLRDAQSQ